MFDAKYFLQQIDELIFYLDDVNGAKLYHGIEREDLAAINNEKELLKAYLFLQFLVIPFLSVGETTSLLSDYLISGLTIKDMDLCERIKKKLLFMDLADRDNCKNTLKSALLANKEIITNEVMAQGKKMRTVSDWLKDYISHVGLKTVKSLEQAKYFFEQTYVFNLGDKDKEILYKIIDLYNFLNTSSLAPEGFEDDLLLKDNQGRVLTTSKGQVAVLYDPREDTKKSTIRSTGVRFGKTEKMEEKNNFAELKRLAAKYPKGSLERKAVEEEIRRMKRE